VVEAAQQPIENNVKKPNAPDLPDPSLIKAARQIYRLYYEVHPKVVQRPLGVVINRVNYRGKLIFSKPILLPQESFVPLNQIESEMY